MTLVLRTYHAGVFPKPQVDENLKVSRAIWIPKEKFGSNQLVVRGSPYERGLEAGRLTAPLLKQQEDVLVNQLHLWIPSDLTIQGLILSSIIWFQGADRYL